MLTADNRLIFRTFAKGFCASLIGMGLAVIAAGQPSEVDVRDAWGAIQHRSREVKRAEIEWTYIDREMPRRFGIDMVNAGREAKRAEDRKMGRSATTEGDLSISARSFRDMARGIVTKGRLLAQFDGKVTSLTKLESVRRVGAGPWTPWVHKFQDFSDGQVVSSFGPFAPSESHKIVGMLTKPQRYRFQFTANTPFAPALFAGASLETLFKREDVKSVDRTSGTFVVERKNFRSWGGYSVDRVLVDLSTGIPREFSMVDPSDGRTMFRGELKNLTDFDGVSVPTSALYEELKADGTVQQTRTYVAQQVRLNSTAKVDDLQAYGVKGAIVTDTRLGEDRPVQYAVQDKLVAEDELRAMAEGRVPTPLSYSASSVGSTTSIALVFSIVMVGLAGSGVSMRVRSRRPAV